MSNTISNPSADVNAAGAPGATDASAAQCAAPAAPELPETMAAAVLAAPRQWEIRQVPLPQPAAPQH